MRHDGFTLLEMIVVLAILGLATALVAPATLRSIDSWQRKAAMDVLVDRIRALPGSARASGKPIVIDQASLASTAPPLVVDAGWTLEVPKAWQVGANGVCQGGEVVVANHYGGQTIQVTAPFCDVRVLP